MFDVNITKKNEAFDQYLSDFMHCTAAKFFDWPVWYMHEYAGVQVLLIKWMVSGV